MVATVATVATVAAAAVVAAAASAGLGSAWAQSPRVAPTLSPATGTPGQGDASPPVIMGLSLGMPLEAAIRMVESIAPPGSVTLPPLRRDTVRIVKIEAPAALKAPVDDSPKDPNFYLMLNSAPRMLKSQSSRSSHVPFITLVAGSDERRLLRVVFEPAFVHWPGGYDAVKRTAWGLAELLRERHSVPVELVSAGRAGHAQPSGGYAGTRTDREDVAQSWWALRVHAERKSIVLTDVTRLQDAFASRLQLD